LSTLIVFILKSMPAELLTHKALTNSWHMAGWKLILREAQQHTGLPDGRVPDNDKFDEVIVLLSARAVHF
jgi:hypothetical protein